MKLKEIIMRYKIFIVLVAINLILGYFSKELGKSSFNITKSNLKEMLLIIPPIFILLGLLDAWVERETMMKFLGRGSGLRGILISFFLGSAAAGPLYAAFPVAIMMLKKGSSLFNVFIFIGAWSTTKIPLLSFEAANLGLRFALLRLCINIFGIMGIACITEKLLTSKESEEIYGIEKKEGKDGLL